MSEEVYTQTRVEGNEVSSEYWTLEAKDDLNAVRIAEMIAAAYRAGREDVSREVRRAIGAIGFTD